MHSPVVFRPADKDSSLALCQERIHEVSIFPAIAHGGLRPFVSRQALILQIDTGSCITAHTGILPPHFGHCMTPISYRISNETGARTVYWHCDSRAVSV